MIHKSDRRLKAVQGMTAWIRTRSLEDYIKGCGELARESRCGAIAHVRQILGKAGRKGALTIEFVCEV